MVPHYPRRDQDGIKTAPARASPRASPGEASRGSPCDALILANTHKRLPPTIKAVFDSLATPIDGDQNWTPFTNDSDPSRTVAAEEAASTVSTVHWSYEQHARFNILTCSPPRWMAQQFETNAPLLQTHPVHQISQHKRHAFRDTALSL